MKSTKEYKMQCTWVQPQKQQNDLGSIPSKPLKITVIQVYAPTSNAKECSNYRTIAHISHASKVMLQILQARLQQSVKFQMFRLVLEKAEKPEIKLPTSAGSWKKQEKVSYYLTSKLTLNVQNSRHCSLV